MKVSCKIDEIMIDGETDDVGVSRQVPGVRVVCSRCGHFVEVYGRSEKSISAGLVTLREECPEGETNFYFDENDMGETHVPGREIPSADAPQDTRWFGDGQSMPWVDKSFLKKRRGFR